MVIAKLLATICVQIALGRDCGLQYDCSPPDGGSRARTPARAHPRHDGLHCLDACAESNVVVVGPSPEGRRAGARPRWLACVLDLESVEEVVAWVRTGGPGVSEPPGLLDLAEFLPTRRSRTEAGER